LFREMMLETIGGVTVDATNPEWGRIFKKRGERSRHSRGKECLLWRQEETV